MLAVNAFRDDPGVWLIFVVSVGLASTSSLQRPSREALMPRTVTHDQLPAANALTSLGMQLGVLVGPAVGGLLVAYVGIGWCFLIDIGGLVVASSMFWRMRSYPHREETTPPSLAGIGEGITYALRAPRPARHLPRRHRLRCCWPSRSCCSRRWPRRSSSSPSCSACSTPPRPSARWWRPR